MAGIKEAPFQSKGKLLLEKAPAYLSEEEDIALSSISNTLTSLLKDVGGRRSNSASQYTTQMGLGEAFKVAAKFGRSSSRDNGGSI